MKIDLMELVKNIPQTKIVNEVFYNFVDFIELVNKMEEKYIDISSDHTITPFYIEQESNMYEIYHMELIILLVENESFENYVLERTGASSIETLKNELVESYRKRYIEVIKPVAHFPVEDLKKWVYSIRNSIELSEEIQNIFNKFDLEKLYFSVY